MGVYDYDRRLGVRLVFRSTDKCVYDYNRLRIPTKIISSQNKTPGFTVVESLLRMYKVCKKSIPTYNCKQVSININPSSMCSCHHVKDLER